jgi:hypothetical protein
VAESLRLIGVAGKAGAGKDTFYEHVLKPRGFLRWQMTLHSKVWLAATWRYRWSDIFCHKPPEVRKVLVCPRMMSTDVDGLRPLASFGERQVIAQRVARRLPVFSWAEEDFRGCHPHSLRRCYFSRPELPQVAKGPKRASSPIV